MSQPPMAEPPPRPPASIEQLLEVITDLTQLIKDQAVDLRASKRLKRLLKAQQSADDRRENRALWLHLDLDDVPSIINELDGRFRRALIDAAGVPAPSAESEDDRDDPGQAVAEVFETLGLTDTSPAWHLKYDAFQAAKKFADSPPIRTRVRRLRSDQGAIAFGAEAGEPAIDQAQERNGQPGSERSRSGRMKKRAPALKMGNSIVGSAAAAIPAAGGLIAEAYGEVKDHLEELGNLARAVGRGLSKPVHWAASKMPWRTQKPEPVREPGATA